MLLLCRYVKICANIFPLEWLIVIQSPGKTSPGWSKMIDLCLMWAFFHEAYLYSFICVILWCITEKDTHHSKTPNMRIQIMGLYDLGIFKIQIFEIYRFISYKEKYIHIIWHIIFYIAASTFYLLYPSFHCCSNKVCSWRQCPF